MTKNNFPLTKRLRIFVSISFMVLILTPIFIFFLVVSIFLKLVLGNIKSEVVMGTIKPFARLLLFWFCALKSLFKPNRRNIALCVCLSRRFKSKKI